MQIVLITGDTRIGDVLGRLLATAKGVNYWDLPLKVHQRQSSLSFIKSALYQVLLGEAQSLHQRTWESEQRQVIFIQYVLPESLFCLFYFESDLKKSTFAFFDDLTWVTDYWRVSSTANCASLLSTRSSVWVQAFSTLRRNQKNALSMEYGCASCSHPNI